MVSRVCACEGWKILNVEGGIIQLECFVTAPEDELDPISVRREEQTYVDRDHRGLKYLDHGVPILPKGRGGHAIL